MPKRNVTHKDIMERLEKIECAITKIEERIKSIEYKYDHERKYVLPISFMLGVFYTVLASIVIADFYYIKGLLDNKIIPSHLDIFVSISLFVIFIVVLNFAPNLINIFIKLAEKKGI